MSDRRSRTALLAAFAVAAGCGLGSGYGAACADDGECAQGLVCLRIELGARSPSAGGTCVEPGRSGERCYHDGDCATGLTCVSHAGQLPFGGGMCETRLDS